jgi:signal transduction histidine kinase/CheY-like chemotaxis protein
LDQSEPHDEARSHETDLLRKDLKRAEREIKRLTAAMELERNVYEKRLAAESGAEHARQEHENYLKLLLLNSPDIIFFFDKFAHLVYATDFFFKKSGITDSSLIYGYHGLKLLELINDKEWAEALNAKLAEAVIANEVISLEETLDIGKTGEPRKYILDFTPMRSESHVYEGSLMYFTDITDIEEARLAAEEASLAKSTFLSNMSHEMRTPMNAIIGMTKIAKDDGGVEKKDYCLDKIEDASVHLLGIINDILDISKIEAGKLELSDETFNFERTLEKVVSSIHYSIDRKAQTLVVEMDKGIPDYLIGDDQRFSQVILNLLSNAMKFTPEGGRIELKAKLDRIEDENCQLYVSVSDTGIGIDKEAQESLFTSFQQADGGISRKFGGTGLGLAISKNIVEMMGGQVWVESELGVGSTFSFVVRMRKADGNSDTQRESNRKDGVGVFTVGEFAGRRLLLAEDVEINREIVMTLLESSGIKIDEAENGIIAVKKFTEDPTSYDLIFMDMQMPDMDGLEATRRIRASDAPNAETIPIIAMTANVFREDVEVCIAAGMNDHLGKPLYFEDMIDMLKQYLP